MNFECKKLVLGAYAPPRLVYMHHFVLNDSDWK